MDRDRRVFYVENPERARLTSQGEAGKERKAEGFGS